MKNKLDRYAYNINSNYVIQEGKDIYNNSKGNWHKIFNNKNPLVLELACGNGEYTVERSIIDPEKNFIGLDIKGARIWKGAKELEKYKSKNAFFLRIQIENIIDFFKKDEVEEIIISFPDPRPKKRDIKKRLTNLNFLKLYYEILNKDGRLILKTDDDNLFNFSIDEIKSSKFILNDYTKDLHSSSKFDLYKSVKTKYEKKFLLQGKKIKLLECLK